jgi:DNA-binding MarR family transcriptional regulator
VPTDECTGLAQRAWTTAAVDASSLSRVSDADVARTWDLVLAGVSATQRRLLAKIEKDGLPGPWFDVLRLLLDADDHRMPMSALARQLHMTAGGFTKLADRMARDGLIDRRNSSADRRVVYAALTPKGTRQAKQSGALYQAALDEHLSGVLSVKQLAQLAQLARTLHDAHADTVDEPSSDGPGDHVLTERDPALPERRGRGRPPR